MNSQEDQSSVEIGATKGARSMLTRPRLIAAAIGLGGMILGSFVGLGVQMGVESTGLLGPSVESLIAEQQSNFNSVNEKLESLRGQADNPEVKKSLAELQKLLSRQDELARHANAELGYLGEQVASLKQQQLAESGFAGGADFWLKTGESVNIGGNDQVFAVLYTRGTIVDVNLNGTRKRMSVGDALPVAGNDAGCTVFYKLASPRADGRIGFDLDCKGGGAPSG